MYVFTVKCSVVLIGCDALLAVSSPLHCITDRQHFYYCKKYKHQKKKVQNNYTSSLINNKTLNKYRPMCEISS